MSTLIKSNDKSHGFNIQRLGAGGVAPPATKPIASANIENPLVAENSRLLTLIEQREAEIIAHAQALAKSFAEGEESGRLAMEAEIDDDRAASLMLLGDGIDAAKTELGHALENAESIALMVAQMALEKMFGETETRKSTVADLIRHQFRQIGHDSFVSLAVSRADFPNTNEVAELAAELSVASDRVRVSDELKAGDCRMRMQLGTLDIGLGRQWGSIRALLEDMAANGEVEEVE
jgi:flagellar biosynthesis/type III secretory pathway protein FliH